MEKVNHYELLLKELKNTKTTPILISRIYKKAILRIGNNQDKWLKINNAICDKWDFSTLEHIKSLAWRDKRNNIRSKF